MKKQVTCAAIVSTIIAAMTGVAQADTVKIQFMHQQVEQERQEVIQNIIDNDVGVKRFPTNLQ